MTPGPLVSGTFYSRRRHRTVGFSIAYPPGHRPGDRLPPVLALHGFGVHHTAAFDELHLQRLLGLRSATLAIAPMAIVAADGGNTYWHRHGNDDPMGMLAAELLPICQIRGLDETKVGAYGWSMGGYGALRLAESHTGLLAAVAATSPAIWTDYAQAQAADPWRSPRRRTSMSTT